MDTRWIDQEGIDLEQETLGKQLRNFLDEEGRLTAFPAKRKMKHLALAYLAGKFQPGARYTEKEINQLLEPLLGRRAGDRVQVEVDAQTKYFVEIRAIEKGADDESLDISSY